MAIRFDMKNNQSLLVFQKIQQNFKSNDLKEMLYESYEISKKIKSEIEKQKMCHSDYKWLCKN